MARVEDPRERRGLYLKVRREKLSVPELLEEIRSRKLLSGPELGMDEEEKEAGPASGAALAPGVQRLPPLKPRRGKFFTYQIVRRPASLHPLAKVYALDLGFRIRHERQLPGLRNPREGEVVEALRTQESPAGDRYRFRRLAKSLGPPRKLLYTHVAYVRDVIDDDTLWADVDMGFRFWPEQKFRLWGIDAAEIEKGKPASDFVKKTLARVAFVVVTVRGRDKFGRPLADLFYLEGTEDREKVLREGIYLNQQLLDLGLARRV